MTANTTMLGFVPDPAGRGTFGILWSCLITLGLCAWTSLHLDLPSKREFHPFAHHIRTPAQDHGRFIKIWWMTIMLFVPEFVLMVAFHDWCKAYQAMRHVNQEGELSTTDMWTMSDGFFLQMGGLTYNDKPVDAGKIYTLVTDEAMSDDMIDLIKDKTIPPQPSRATEIRDKSKSDALGKVLTCAQALWLAIQCLARTIQRLPISTLELGTIGYVFIAVAINGLYWYKPKDVLTSLELRPWEARGTGPEGERLDAPVDTSKRDVADNGEEKAFFSGRKSSTRWETWLDRLAEDALKLEQVTLVLVCASYGGWHCLAWNFAFPSLAEKWLWRIGSILTSLPALVLMLEAFTDHLPSQIEDHIGNILEIGVLVLYILSRGFILVEMFIGLRRLPAGVFDTVQWMAFIPHV